MSAEIDDHADNVLIDQSIHRRMAKFFLCPGGADYWCPYAGAVQRALDSGAFREWTHFAPLV